MKNRSVVTKLITILFSAAVVAYFGVEAWNYFTASVETAEVYTYRAEHTASLKGRFVRDEETIPCADALVELTRAEGERVSKGQPLATVYNSEQALADAQELAGKREQLEQLRYARDAARDAETALRLDSEIERSIISLRAAYASGNYAALDGGVSALRSSVLRREYAYRGNSGLDERIEALEAEISSLSASLSGKSHTVRAPFAGTYSAASDGWERALTPEMLPALTPASYDRIVPVAPEASAGRLIRGSTWYYVAVLSEEESQGIERGGRYTLVASGVDEQLPVSVMLLTAPQEGRCLLVLKSDRYLAAVTALRAQDAELVTESHTGLRIPKNALRVDEAGNAGVYCLIGRIAYFKPVTLLYQGEDYCLVLPGEIDAKRESDLVLYTLRPGDQVIVTASSLYDGKVVR